MDAEDIIKGMAMMAAIHAKSEGTARDRSEQPIEELAKSYLKRHEFKVGDRVTLKKGLGGILKFPKPGQTAVVIDVLSEPILPTFEKSFGSPHFMAPHNVRLAVKDSDGDFVYFLVDGGLFEPAVKAGKVVDFKRK